MNNADMIRLVRNSRLNFLKSISQIQARVSENLGRCQAEKRGEEEVGNKRYKQIFYGNIETLIFAQDTKDAGGTGAASRPPRQLLLTLKAVQHPG